MCAQAWNDAVRANLQVTDPERAREARLRLIRRCTGICHYLLAGTRGRVSCVVTLEVKRHSQSLHTIIQRRRRALKVKFIEHRSEHIAQKRVFA